MSNKYNVIEYIAIGFRHFGLKYVFIYYINYSRKLFKVFISPTSGIRAYKTHDLGKTQQRSMPMVLNNVKGFGFGHTHLGFEITSNLMEF